MEMVVLMMPNLMPSTRMVLMNEVIPRRKRTISSGGHTTTSRDSLDDKNCGQKNDGQTGYHSQTKPRLRTWGLLLFWGQYRVEHLRIHRGHAKKVESLSQQLGNYRHG